MYFLLGLICYIVGILVGMAIFYSRSAKGDMDVKWDDATQCWKATMHLSQTINYSKIKKLILKINANTIDSRK